MTNNQLAPERISDISDYFVEMQDHYSDPADRENFEIFRDAELLMKELQEHRKAAMDSEPVMYCSEETLAAARDGEHLLRTLSSPSGECVIPLYRHALPAPVVNYVPLGDSPYDVPYSMPSNLRELIAEEIGILFSDDDAQSVWNVCRSAAMLQAGNSPVIPGWIPVSERMPEIRKHWLDLTVIIAISGEKYGSEALYCSDGNFRWGRDEPPIDDVTHWMPLPAAPQEVK